MIFVVAPREPGVPVGSHLVTMGRAIRVRKEQRPRHWQLPGLGVGVLERDDSEPLPFDCIRCGTVTLWVFGEIYSGGGLVPGEGITTTRTPDRAAVAGCGDVTRL